LTRTMLQFSYLEMWLHVNQPTQATILVALNAKENLSMAELSDLLGMDRTTLL